MKRINFRKIAFGFYIKRLFCDELGKYLYDNVVCDIRQVASGSVYVYCSRGFIPSLFLRVAAKATDCSYYVDYDKNVEQCVLIFSPNFMFEYED